MSYQTIISAADLAGYLDDHSWLILDCRGQFLGGKKSYDNFVKAHIPNAYFCSFSENYLPKFIESGFESRDSIMNPKNMLDCLVENGFEQTSQIVIYDSDSNSFTDTLWLQFRALGCPNVAVLQGGFGAWKKQNYALTKKSEVAR